MGRDQTIPLGTRIKCSFPKLWSGGLYRQRGLAGGVPDGKNGLLNPHPNPGGQLRLEWLGDQARMKDVLLPDTFQEQHSWLLLAPCHLQGKREESRLEMTFRSTRGGALWTERSCSCQGPARGLKVGWAEDVADGVAMAALPPCVVITCSNATKEGERKVCVLRVGGRTGTGAWGREGTEKSPGDFFTPWLFKAYSMCGSVCLGA